MKFTSGPFNPGDKVWYYAIDENKVKRGKKYGRWWKAEVVGTRKSMVIIDLGTKIISVNQSLLRNDYDLLGDVEIPLAPDESEEPVQKKRKV